MPWWPYWDTVEKEQRIPLWFVLEHRSLLSFEIYLIEYLPVLSACSTHPLSTCLTQSRYYSLMKGHRSKSKISIKNFEKEVPNSKILGQNLFIYASWGTEIPFYNKRTLFPIRSFRQVREKGWCHLAKILIDLQVKRKVTTQISYQEAITP